MSLKIKHVVLTSLILGYMAPAFAIGTGMYLGMDVGMSNTHNHRRTLPNTNISTTANNTGVAGRFFLGGVGSKYFAAEFGITHYAESTYTFPNGSSGSIHTNAFDFEAVPMYPFGESGFYVFGKVGFAYLRAVQSRTLYTTGQQSVNSGAHPIIGLGAAYEMTSRWVADLSWTEVVSHANQLPSASLFGLGISYHITDTYCGQFLC
jgi:hypothetical protein